MCGIAAICGEGWTRGDLDAMVESQHHRGPDGAGIALHPGDGVGFGHNRLRIIDLTDAGRQPMTNHDGTLSIVFNGEIYNYLELRSELDDYPYRSRTDTEVILAAYERWGDACLDRFIGMFAFALWDSRQRRLLAVRDRFGVKPLHYAQRPGALFLSSEIKALHAAGVPARFDEATWANYLVSGSQGDPGRTFWTGVRSLPAGCALSWHGGRTRIWRWYELAERVGSEVDRRSVAEVEEEYLALLVDSVRKRFRSDVPVGINVSGGLDSSMLVGLVRAVQGPESGVQAFTFATGDARYDELPWVRPMLAATRHPSVVCELGPADVPALAESVQIAQDEPFGGIPTLAYARLFERARAENVIVLLDGQGLDEQWAGYDYYAAALCGRPAGVVQGTTFAAATDCLVPEFRALSQPSAAGDPFADALRNIQYRDVTLTKLPRALRFNDRASMRSSVELREPFVDHRLFELALRQPPERKINGGVHKWLVRRIADRLMPAAIARAPKRPVQTPQREWLGGMLREWADACIEAALAQTGGHWLDAAAVRAAWARYCASGGDSSFQMWQWINLGLMSRQEARRPRAHDEWGMAAAATCARSALAAEQQPVCVEGRSDG